MSGKAYSLGFLLLSVALCSGAEPLPVAKKLPTGLRKLFIDPSSASLAGGKARLTLTSLVRNPGVYVGDYELKVTPYFFKSEKGKLLLTVSDQALLKLAQSVPTEFSGSATTAVTGKTRPTRVKATPSTKDRGAVTITVTTENGALVFNTFYRFADK